eukprot:GHVS01063447.1.p2 GENE.GHVS01063447.1~~GHVS01063447.1.p2  ORF type:complete len:241 (-),score=35.24 GHVS01063447.1:1050-1721(-)
MRCPRCHAYANPFMSWNSGGRECICNLCEHTFELSESYMSAIEAFTSQRQQQQPSQDGRSSRGDRPEIWRGSVDYVAPPAFDAAREVAQPPAYCFVVDTSIAAQTNNFSGSVFQAIRQSLSQFPSVSTDVALLTYDSNVQFYSIDTLATNKPPEVLVMPDVDEPFCPAPIDSLLINVEEHRSRVQTQHELHSKYTKDTPHTVVHKCTYVCVILARQLIGVYRK